MNGRGSTIAMADGNMDIHSSDSRVITRKSLRATAIGLICFAVVGLLVSAIHRSTAAFPEIAVLNEKLSDFEAMSPAPDIVFLGSSQTFRHINPAIVDATLAQCGMDLESYNFGVPALREPEMRYIAERVREATDTPKLVVIQNPIRAETVYSNMMSERGRYFRGGEHTGAALRDVQCYSGTSIGRYRSLFNTLRSVTAELFGLGRLAQATVPADLPQPPPYNEAYRFNAGYFPVDQDGNRHIVDRLTSSPMTDAILAMGRAGDGFTPSNGIAACRADQLTTMLDDFRSMGVDVAYFVSPAPLDFAHDQPITRAMAEKNPDMPIFDFNSADAAARYFNRALWYDGAHMTGDGADTLSRELGQQLCQVLKE